MKAGITEVALGEDRSRWCIRDLLRSTGFRLSFGLHVIEGMAREPGVLSKFEAVQSAVELALERQRYATAWRQYLQLLAGQCEIESVDLATSNDPLVQ